MSRSRFEKLEGERAETDDVPAADKSLDARFGAEPDFAPAATAPASAEALNRFDTDGGEGLGLDRDPLAELPMLQCPQCQTDCGKFETACSRCGTSLTSDAARAHNLKRVETQRAARQLAQEAEQKKREDEIRDIGLNRVRLQEAQQGFAEDLHDKFGGDRRKVPAWPFFVGAVVSFGLARLVPWFGLRVVFVAVGVVCLLTRLPASAWVALGKPAKRRGGF